MAFEILAKLGLNATGFKSGLKQAESVSQSWGKRLAATVAAAFAVDRIKAFAEANKEIVEQAQQLEFSLGQVRRILDKGGFEGIGAGELEKFAAAIREAAGGGKDPFAQLGVSIRNANGELKSNQQILTEFTEAIQQTESSATKLGAAVEIVGIKKAGALVRTLQEVDTKGGGAFEQLQDAGTLALTELASGAEGALGLLGKLARAASGIVLAPLATPGEFRQLSESIRQGEARRAEERKRQLAEEEAMLLEFYNTEEAAAERIKQIKEETAAINREAMMKGLTDQERLVKLQEELWDIAKRGAANAEEAAQNELDFAKKKAEVDELGRKIGPAAELAAPLAPIQATNQLQRIGAQVGGVPRTETLLKQQVELQKKIERNTARGNGEVIPA